MITDDDKLTPQQRYYKKNRERVIANARRWQQEHSGERKEYMKDYRDKNYERELERARAWKEANKEKHRASSREYSRKHAAEISLKLKEQRRQLKQSILDAYGGKCACCGEGAYEFLTLDHIDGNGAAHRKSLGFTNGRSKKLYVHLVEAGFPPGYRILCFNCNSALGFYGYCPHNPDSTDGVPPTRRKAIP